MNRQQYIEFHKQFCDDMVEITRKKNHDYAGDGEDPFKNFRQIGGLVSTEGVDVVAVGFLTRMSDKFSRVGTHISKGGKLLVEDESIEDTLKDLANYSALFAGYLREKKELLDAARKSNPEK